MQAHERVLGEILRRFRVVQDDRQQADDLRVLGGGDHANDSTSLVRALWPMSGTARIGRLRWLLGMPDRRPHGRARHAYPGPVASIDTAHQDVRFCRAPDGARIAYAVHGSDPPLVITVHR